MAVAASDSYLPQPWSALHDADRRMQEEHLCEQGWSSSATACKALTFYQENGTGDQLLALQALEEASLHTQKALLGKKPFAFHILQGQQPRFPCSPTNIEDES